MRDEEKILRTFIAFGVEQSVLDEVARVQEKLKRAMARDFKVTWNAPEVMHLTLVFLGDTPESKIPALKSILNQVAPEYAAMPCQLTGPGYFGPLRRPRVLTIGLEAPPELAELQELIAMGCKELGFEQDKREYVPHLTLGRIRTGGTAEVLEPLLEKVSKPFPMPLLLNRISLIQSKLSHEGAVHTDLHTICLS